jgi:predicted dehydrogenase
MKFLIVLLTIISISVLGNDKPLRLGVVNLTHSHVGWVFDSQKNGDFVIAGIVEPNKEVVEKYRKRYGFSPQIVYSSLDEMLDVQKPEAVAAFGPIYDHLMIVQKCAPLGIHVMVEKPLAVSLKHARKMEALAKKHQIHLFTNYETTWYPSHDKMMEMIEAKAVGEVKKVVVRDGHKGPKKINVPNEFFEWLTDPVLNGGGAITDFGCYGANLMTWIMRGERPLSVTASLQQLQKEIYPKVDDDATVILTYKNANAILQPSWSWPIGRKDMEVYGETGALFADNRNHLRYRKVQGYDGFEESKFDLPELKPPFNDPFSLFAKVIKGEVVLEDYDLSSLENNMLVMEILDAAIRSAKKGKTIHFRN